MLLKKKYRREEGRVIKRVTEKQIASLYKHILSKNAHIFMVTNSCEGALLDASVMLLIAAFCSWNWGASSPHNYSIIGVK